MIGTMVQQDLALEMELHDTKDMILCTSSNFIVDCRLANDSRPGRLRDPKIMVDFKIVVDRLQNHDRHDGPAGFSTGNGTS